MTNNEALIISKRIIPAYQLATLLERNGFYPHVDDGDRSRIATFVPHLAMLVVDIDDADIQGIEIAKQYLALNSGLACYALCIGGNAPAMQQYESLMFDDFFFLSATGMTLDCRHGAVVRFMPAHGGTDASGGSYGRMQRGYTDTGLQPCYA